MEVSFVSNSKEETRSFGKVLASVLKAGDVILLEGDLGAGKTTLVGGVAKGLSIEGDVISPTFNIMKCYFGGKLPLYHIDAYRLENQNIELGLDEYIEGNGACFIEWPVFIEPLIPDEHLKISLHHLGEDRRKVVISSDDPRWFAFIEKAKEDFHAC